MASNELKNQNVSQMFLALGAIALALEPTGWLIGTWFRPGYEGMGWMAALLTVGIVFWSYRSPVQSHDVAAVFNPLWILMVTACLRLSAQLLAIDTIGAFLLCVDVYAIAHLLKLPHRRQSVSPVWLGLLFLFALPIEPILQRVVGYGLQLISADLACGLLGYVVADLSCSGVRILAAGKDILIDLPCSGAELLSVMGLSLAVINTLTRPNLLSSALSVLVTVLSALICNALRIAILGIGIVHEESLGFSVLTETPHTLIGLVTTALGVCAIAFFARFYSTSRSKPAYRPKFAQPGIVSSALFFLFALSVGAFQPRPVDALPRLPPLTATRVAADFLATPEPLSTQEQLYFETYGGSASKTSYGPFSLLTVTTTSPLRHLHDPAVCLRANGFDVTFEGTDFDIGGTIYRARTDEREYEIRVSYLSAAGEHAHSISEVVWHWLRAPRTRWTMVQRIIPVGLDGREWDRGILRSLNIPLQSRKK